MSRFQFLQLSLSALLLCFGGCSGGSSLDYGSVEGTVTLDGAPLTQASVTFYPKSGERSSTGETDENGKYSLRHTRAIRGAVVGEHTVTISVAEDDKQKLPLKYGSRKQSDETRTVEGGSNTIDLPLKSK